MLPDTLYWVINGEGGSNPGGVAVGTKGAVHVTEIHIATVFNSQANKIQFLLNSKHFFFLNIKTKFENFEIYSIISFDLVIK